MKGFYKINEPSYIDDNYYKHKRETVLETIKIVSLHN